MKTPIQDTKAEIHINPNKFKATQPDLTGEFSLAEHRFGVALWEQTAQQSGQTYYSGSIAERGVENAALTRIKLFEFRRRGDADPDLRGKEPVSLDGDHFYLYAWWRRSTEGDIWLELEFSHSQRLEPPSPEAEKFRTQLLEKFGKNRPLTLTDSTTQKPEPAKRGFNFDKGNDSEPDDVPF